MSKFTSINQWVLRMFEIYIWIVSFISLYISVFWIIVSSQVKYKEIKSPSHSSASKKTPFSPVKPWPSGPGPADTALPPASRPAPG